MKRYHQINLPIEVYDRIKTLSEMTFPKQKIAQMVTFACAKYIKEKEAQLEKEKDNV